MASVASLKAALPTSSNVHTIHEKLGAALAAKGFFLAGSSYADRYANPNDPGSQTLFVYNRGINADGTLSGKSNYNICVLCRENNLRVFMSNPDESATANKFDCDSYVQTFTYKAGSSEKFISSVVSSAEKLSALKPECNYRIFLHNHLGELSGLSLNTGDHNMKDDGVSSDHALLVNLLLHNADFCAVTHHNNFLLEQWHAFNSEAQKYGVQLIAGFEATLPIFEHEPWLNPNSEAAKNHNPNGPHTLLLFKSGEQAADFWQQHFSNRADYWYAPSASANVQLDQIYKIIDEQHALSIARVACHPACQTSLPDVGLLHRVSKGEITVQEMFGVLKRTQGVEKFNMTLDDNEFDFGLYKEQVEKCSHFTNDEKSRRKANMVVAYRYFRAILGNQLSKDAKMTPNNLNIALAAECQKPTVSLKRAVLKEDKTVERSEWTAGELPIHPVVGTDGHNFNWLYTRLGPFFWMVNDMGLFGRGHNTLSLAALPGKKPLSSDVVSFLIDKNSLPGATLTPVLFSSALGKEGIIRITEARQDKSWTQKTFDTLEKGYYYLNQGWVLLSGIFKNMVEKKVDLYTAATTPGRGSIPD